MPSRVRLLAHMVLSGLLRTGDLIIDCIDVGIFNDRVKRFEYTVAKKEMCIRDSYQRVLIPTGLAIAIPDGYAGFVQPRSGMALKQGLSIANTPGPVSYTHLDVYKRQRLFIPITLNVSFARLKCAMRVFPTPIRQLGCLLYTSHRRGAGGQRRPARRGRHVLRRYQESGAQRSRKNT